MTPGEIDPTLPDDAKDERATGDASRSELEKETSAIERPRLDPPIDATVMGTGQTDRTVLSGPDADIVPGYQMVSKLGEGGMGVVYKAVQRSLNREVALKVMKNPSGDESFVARFRREAITGARLNHPNIVSVYDHGHFQGSVYLVLEFVRGRNCSELIDERGHLSVREALEVTRGAVLGLSHALDQGVIHRDIKPANLMVIEGTSGDARRRQSLVAKVADFGLARLHDGHGDPDHQDLTQTGSVMGTPGYMAPEQALGRSVDFRADIYSLGSTLYCLITGTKPFQGNTVIEVLHKKINEFAIDPRDLVGDVPDGVVRVIDRMMAKQADDRYQSYENLLHDIDRLLAGQEPDTAPVEAHSRSIGPPAGRTIAVRRTEAGPDRASAPGRRKGLLVGIVAAAVLAIVAVAYFGRDREPEPKPPGRTTPEAGATIESRLVAWEGESGERFVADAEANWARLDADLAGVEAAEAGRLRERFRARLRRDLAALSSALATDIEGLWKARAWPALKREIERQERLLDLAAASRPERLDELAGFATAALADDAARTEEARAAELLSGAPTRAELEDFRRDYAFSPDLHLIEQKLARIAGSDDARRALEAELAALEGRDPEAFFADGAALAAIAARIAALGDASARDGLESTLAALRGRKTDALLAATHAKLDEAFASRDFVTMKAQVELLQGLCARNGIAPPDWLVAHEENVRFATPARVQAEKVAWADIGKTEDPTILIPLLESYLDRFAAFSPSIAEAESMLKAAREKAPAFVLRVEPADARIRVNDVLKPGPEVRMNLTPGPVTVVVEADGYFQAERLVSHGADAPPVEIRLMPRPARRLGVQGSANVPLHINPSKPNELPFPNVPGTALGIAVEPIAGVRFSSAKSDWRATSRSMFDNDIARAVFRDGRWSGWQLRGVLHVAEGEAEIRVLDDDRGRCVVVGLSPGAFYLGERDGDQLRRRIDVAIPGDCRSLRFALSFEEDLAILEIATGDDLLEGRPDRVVASLKPGHEPRRKGDIAIAVKKGEAIFGELELYPLN